MSSSIETHYIPVSELAELVNTTSGRIYIVGESDAQVLITGEVTRSLMSHGYISVETEIGVVHYEDDEEIDLIETPN